MTTVKQAILRRLAVSVLAGATFFAASPAAAAEWPEKRIEFVVPWAPGGGTDLVGRALASSLSEILGTPVPVINKPGGAGVVGHTAIRRAAPDGYTFGFITPQLVSAPILGTSTLSYEEMQPLAMINADPGAIVVAVGAPWKSLQEFVAYARANPGKVSIANTGEGGISHMVAVELERKAGISVIHAPYNGAAPAIRDLIGGHIGAATVTAVEARSQINAGLARVLAVMAPKRLEAFPDAPTAREQGLDIDLGTWRGLAIPQGVPAPIAAKLQEAIRKAVADPKFKDFMDNQGFGISYLASADFVAFLKQQDATYRAFFNK